LQSLLATSRRHRTSRHGPAARQVIRFSTGDIVREGHRFFGTVSRGLAQIVETAVSRWGQPNGYILGQEGSGAFVVGLRYGDGKSRDHIRGAKPRRHQSNLCTINVPLHDEHAFDTHVLAARRRHRQNGS
jgi:hypothetical protein